MLGGGGVAAIVRQAADSVRRCGQRAGDGTIITKYTDAELDQNSNTGSGGAAAATRQPFKLQQNHSGDRVGGPNRYWEYQEHWFPVPGPTIDCIINQCVTQSQHLSYVTGSGEWKNATTSTVVTVQIFFYNGIYLGTLLGEQFRNIFLAF